MHVMDMFKLDGRVALVTGGAGLYGSQITEALAEAGATVITASRTLEKNEAFAEKMRERGLKVYADTYDQADEQSILALRDRLVAKYGKVDILVNNSALRGCFKGGFDGGALAPDNKPEANFNLTFCRILKPILEKYGFKVTLTRRDDSGLEDASAKTVREKIRSDMHKRLVLMNETPNCIFISIHQNKSPYTSAHGSVVYYSPNHPESETLAAALQSAFIAHLQPTNKRTIVQAGSNLFLLHNAPCPAVLVECGFLSNPQEEKKLKDASYQKALCSVIATTVSRYLSNT